MEPFYVQLRAVDRICPEALAVKVSNAMITGCLWGHSCRGRATAVIVGVLGVLLGCGSPTGGPGIDRADCRFEVGRVGLVIGAWRGHLRSLGSFPYNVTQITDSLAERVTRS